MLRCEILITKVSDTKPRPWLCDRNAHVALSQKSPQNSARGDRTGAIDVLDEVPSTSRHYGEAQLTSVLVLLDGRPIVEITEADLRNAAKRVRRVVRD